MFGVGAGLATKYGIKPKNQPQQQVPGTTGTPGFGAGIGLAGVQPQKPQQQAPATSTGNAFGAGLLAAAQYAQSQQQPTSITDNRPPPAAASAPAENKYASITPGPQAAADPGTGAQRTAIDYSVTPRTVDNTVQSFGVQNQGNVTQMGDVRDKQVMDYVQGDQTDQVVQNAERNVGRDNYLRMKMAEKQAQQRAAQMGMDPQDPRYQQMIRQFTDEATNANIGARNDVNRIRESRYDKYFDMLTDIENTSYDRGKTERDYKTNRADTQYSRDTSERTYQDGRDDEGFRRQQDRRGYEDDRSDLEYNRTEGRRTEQKAEALSALQSTQDPRVQMNLRGILNSQGPAAMLAEYNEIHQIGTGEAGRVDNKYASTDPATKNRAAVEARVRAAFPEFDDQKVQDEVQKILQRELEATNQPGDDFKLQKAIREAERKLNSNEPLSDADLKTAMEEGLIKQAPGGKIPTGKEVRAFLAENPHGYINVKGRAVKVLPEQGDMVNHFYTYGLSRQPRRYDWVAVEVDGKKYKIDNRGNWYRGNDDMQRQGDSLSTYKYSDKNSIPSPLE